MPFIRFPCYFPIFPSLLFTTNQKTSFPSVSSVYMHNLLFAVSYFFVSLFSTLCLIKNGNFFYLFRSRFRYAFFVCFVRLAWIQIWRTIAGSYANICGNQLQWFRKYLPSWKHFVRGNLDWHNWIPAAIWALDSQNTAIFTHQVPPVQSLNRQESLALKLSTIYMRYI